MTKHTIRLGVASVLAATLIGAGLTAPTAHASSAVKVDSKIVTINLNNTDELKAIAAKYGINIDNLLNGISGTVTKPSQTVTKPATKPAAKPVTKPAAKPSAGTAAKQGTGTTNNGGSDNSATMSDFQSQVVSLVNAERKKAGLPALKSDALLTKVAMAKAKDMDENNYFSHTSPTYGSPFDMMRQFGVSYSYAGENIASGQKTPQEVMNAWMNSQGHRENILNKNYTKIGVGYVNGEWVQEFTG